MAPFTRVIQEALTEPGACPHPSTDLGHVPISIPTALEAALPPQQAPLCPRPWSALRGEAARQPPMLWQRSMAGKVEEKGVREELRGCSVGPDGAETQGARGDSSQYTRGGRVAARGYKQQQLKEKQESSSYLARVCREKTQQ